MEYAGTILLPSALLNAPPCSSRRLRALLDAGLLAGLAPVGSHGFFCRIVSNRHGHLSRDREWWGQRQVKALSEKDTGTLSGIAGFGQFAQILPTLVFYDVFWPACAGVRGVRIQKIILNNPQIFKDCAHASCARMQGLRARLRTPCWAGARIRGLCTRLVHIVMYVQNSCPSPIRMIFVVGIVRGHVASATAGGAAPYVFGQISSKTPEGWTGRRAVSTIP